MFFILLILLILSNNVCASFYFLLDMIYRIYKILYILESCLIVSVFFLSRNLRGLRELRGKRLIKGFSVFCIIILSLSLNSTAKFGLYYAITWIAITKKTCNYNRGRDILVC